MDDYGSQSVQLHIYDLSQGAAALMSGMLLGRQIDGIWHTAVVAYGREYFYGGQGIQSIIPVSVIKSNHEIVERKSISYVNELNVFVNHKFGSGYKTTTEHNNYSNNRKHGRIFVFGENTFSRLLLLPSSAVSNPKTKAASLQK